MVCRGGVRRVPAAGPAAACGLHWPAVFKMAQPVLVESVGVHFPQAARMLKARLALNHAGPEGRADLPGEGGGWGWCRRSGRQQVGPGSSGAFAGMGALGWQRC